MKKIILILLLLLLLTGCNQKELMNTPTKKVEMFLENYQTLNEKIVDQLTKTANEEEKFNAENREEYIKIMKKHYQNLTYEIKNEKIDGESAVVTVEIEVTNLKKAIDEADEYLVSNEEEFKENGTYNEFLFMKYKLKKLSEEKETIKYTLDLTLSKIDGEWKLDNISSIDEQKINGIYDYS